LPTYDVGKIENGKPTGELGHTHVFEGKGGYAKDVFSDAGLITHLRQEHGQDIEETTRSFELRQLHNRLHKKEIPVRLPPDQLYVDSVWVKPVNFDFGTGYTEKWEIVYPTGYDEEKDDPDNGGIERFEPMMNYYYPLPHFNPEHVGDAEKVAKILDKEARNLTLIRLLDETEEQSYVMALTGGGMDFSWEICEAYMLAGYLPPFHFALPNMAGLDKDKRTEWILAGCRRSAEVVAGQASGRLTELVHLTSALNIREIVKGPTP
jgi:hypothetical protein